MHAVADASAEDRPAAAVARLPSRALFRARRASRTSELGGPSMGGMLGGIPWISGRPRDWSRMDIVTAQHRLSVSEPLILSPNILISIGGFGLAIFRRHRRDSHCSTVNPGTYVSCRLYFSICVNLVWSV
jgi:hypothetical protein